MMEELKPCPFCGGKAEIGTYIYDRESSICGGFVECTMCGISYNVGVSSQDLIERELTNLWNTRYEPTCYPVSGHGIPTKVFCARCDEPLLGAANYCPNCGARVVEVEE